MTKKAWSNLVTKQVRPGSIEISAVMIKYISSAFEEHGFGYSEPFNWRINMTVNAILHPITGIAARTTWWRIRLSLPHS